MSKKNQWPKEMLHPRYLPMEELEVHDIKNPLYGHVLGKDVAFGDNGSKCTVVGMLAIEGEALYQLHFMHPDYEHGFTAGLPARCLKKPSREGTVCETCIYLCDDECDGETKPQEDGTCTHYQSFDDEDDDGGWSVDEDNDDK